MAEQTLIKLIEYGGAIGIIIAMTLFLSYLRKNGANSDLLKKIKEIEENHIQHLMERLNKLEEMNIDIIERLAKLETLIENSKCLKKKEK